jgi:hypothetical protein
MRWAFVLRLGSDTQPLQRHFDGLIEEVDTGKERRFRSTEELLTFLAECFEAARPAEHIPCADDEKSSGIP